MRSHNVKFSPWRMKKKFFSGSDITKFRNKLRWAFYYILDKGKKTIMTVSYFIVFLSFSFFSYFLYFYKLFYDLGFPYPEIDNSRGVRFLQYFTIFYNFPWMNFQVNKISQIYDFFCDFTKLIHANVFSEYCSGCLTVTVLLSYGN